MTRSDIHLLAPKLPQPAPARIDEAVARAVQPLAAAGPLTVLVNDPQRQTATRAVLEALRRQCGGRPVRLLVAAGSHRTPPAGQADFERALAGGLDLAEIAWHDCRSGDLVAIGPGSAWRGHRWLVEGEALLVIGSVEPHYFAGFTGAHKTATVGVAAYGDIEANHAAALGAACRPGRLAGNPVAEGVFAMLAALEEVRPVRAVNLVQVGSQVLAAAGGAPREALQAAVPDAREAFVREIDGPADAIIAEVTGPLARSFYQADKGIKNSEWAVRDGGCLVLVAACPEGIGQDAFVGLLRRARTHGEAVAAVRRRGYRLGDHKAVRLRHLTDPATRGVRGMLVSEGISPAEAGLLGLAKAPDVDAALAAAGVRPGRDRVFHVRDAGNLVVTAV